MYGCEKDSPHGELWKCGKYKFARCPLAIVDYGINSWIRAYRRYEKGLLPNAGGWADQSAKFIDMINIVDGLSSEVGKENAARNKQSKTRNIT